MEQVANGSAFPGITPDFSSPEIKSNVDNLSKKDKENNPPIVPPAVNKKPKRSPGIPLGAGKPLGVYTAARKKSEGFSNIMNVPNIRVTIPNTRKSGRANRTADSPPLKKARVGSSTVYPVNCEGNPRSLQGLSWQSKT